ncbi:MAG: ADP-ribosylglycohydrolase family protein [Deltaproteobacteria bacterium]|nr:ADP-ribosylglycohydrolase family protein [Deltaproteobacteria bacterium]
MIGAIAGDIIGSVYEFRPIKTTDFPLFTEESTYTDDTVLTVATGAVLLDGGDYASSYRRWGLRYPDMSYGSMFRQWLRSKDLGPYGSYGNGSAMRVVPIGWAFDTLNEVLREAERSARATHDHPEGIKGAQVTAGSVFLARTGAGKDGIRAFAGSLGYDLDRTLTEIRPGYRFDETCQGSVPESLLAFLESDDFEGAVRNAVSLGGDADTMACIAGGIAEAFYGGVPLGIRDQVLRLLTVEMGAMVARFAARYGGGHNMNGRPGLEEEQ